MELPTLILYGTKDTTIPPERAVCGFQRLAADGANAKVCVVVRVVLANIISSVLVELLPVIAHSLTADGGPVECATPPPTD